MLFLLKPGELFLKGDNRKLFVRALFRNTKCALHEAGCAEYSVFETHGRIFVRCPESEARAAEDAFAHLFGITGWSRATETEKDLNRVKEAAVQIAEAAVRNGAATFRVSARRSDKSFTPDSNGISRLVGAAVLDAFPALKVHLTEPALHIKVEIRERAYIYGAEKRGLRGLPVGTAGRGLLLLSGGIDSPAAGFLMAGRGLSLSALYFHAPPYTGEDALQKARKLSTIIGRYAPALRFFAAPFTEVERMIESGAPTAWKTLLLRMAMMSAASNLAESENCSCLVTGESLSQVASQTASNIACTESTARFPVMRPLIGLDKEAIIDTAQKIGTYETSILPYADCCTLFSPPHPVLRGAVSKARELYDKLRLDEAVQGVKFDRY